MHIANSKFGFALRQLFDAVMVYLVTVLISYILVGNKLFLMQVVFLSIHFLVFPWGIRCGKAIR